jgi:hypothetical protein
MRTHGFYVLVTLIAVAFSGCRHPTEGALLRMRGEYARPSEGTTLDITPDEFVLKNGTQKLAAHYEVRRIEGARVTIGLEMPRDNGERGMLEMAVTLDEDGGITVSTPIPNAGGSIPGKYTARLRSGGTI